MYPGYRTSSSVDTGLAESLLPKATRRPSEELPEQYGCQQQAQGGQSLQSVGKTNPRRPTRKPVGLNRMDAVRPFSPLYFSSFTPEPARLAVLRRGREIRSVDPQLDHSSSSGIKGQSQVVPFGQIARIHALPTPEEFRRELLGQSLRAPSSPSLDQRSTSLQASPSSVASSQLRVAVPPGFSDSLLTSPTPPSWSASEARKRSPPYDQTKGGLSEGSPPSREKDLAESSHTEPQNQSCRTSNDPSGVPAASQLSIQQLACSAARPPSPILENELLHTVKHLPERPVFCPPSSTEGRFQPSILVKTSKLRLRLLLAEQTVVAGAEVFGHFNVVFDEGLRAKLGSTEVLIGEIGVELIGFEETQRTNDGHEDHAFTFLYTKQLFQRRAEVHPVMAASSQILTDAVTANPPPDGDGFWRPTRGTTSFPFSFAVPRDCTSSGNFGLCSVRYAVTAFVHCKLQGNVETIAVTEEVRICELWDKGNPAYDQVSYGRVGRPIANYEEVFIEASLDRSLFVEGEDVKGSIRVLNNSRHKVREVKLLLSNHVTFFADHRALPNDPDLTEGQVGSSTTDRIGVDSAAPSRTALGAFAGPRDDKHYDLPQHSFTEARVISRGEDQTWSFTLPLSTDGSLVSIRNAALFDVAPQLCIRISRGPLHKSSRLRMPLLSIAGKASMLDPAAQPRSGEFWKNSVAATVPCDPYTFVRLINMQPAGVRTKAGCQTIHPQYYLDARARIRILDPAFV
ncbi:hypothetical protein PYCC9005_006035 [Savitreella phatthalungensis]